jgi:hypothetical protein
MLVPYVLENLSKIKSFLGSPNTSNSIIRNIWEYHFVIKTENGKFMILNPNTTLIVVQQSQIIILLSFSMKPEREEQI